MKYLKYSIYFWALCDIIHLIGLGAGWMARQEFPFLYELQYAFTQASDGFDISGFYTVLFLILIDLSTFFSAYFLVKQKRFATYICLIQTVIRLFLGQSSIPIVNTVMMSSGTINPYVVGVIETFKILSIAIWHIYYIKKSTIKEYLPNLLSYLLKPKTIVIFFIANQVLSLLFFLAANISNPYQQFLGNLWWNLGVFAFSVAIALSALKNQAVGISSFCVWLFVYHSIKLISFLLEPKEFIFVSLLIITINVYFITAALIISFRTKREKNYKEIKST